MVDGALYIVLSFQDCLLIFTDVMDNPVRSADNGVVVILDNSASIECPFIGGPVKFVSSTNLGCGFIFEY